MPTLEQYRGCLLGLALGDALGAPYEGGLIERLLWRAIGSTRVGQMRWTDDTQMAIDLVESFLSEGTINPDDLAMRFARSYRWSRGYGPGAARVLKRIARGIDWREANCSVYPEGSFGNGAAMRVPMLGLIFGDHADELAEMVRSSAIVTHAHPVAVEGALLVALVAGLVARGHSPGEIYGRATGWCSLSQFQTRLTTAREWELSAETPSPGEVARALGRGIAAHESCVTGVYLALRFQNQAFLEMQRFIAAGGGDVDTIGAMAGAIWGASNGVARLPDDALAILEQRERLDGLAVSLHEMRASHA